MRIWVTVIMAFMAALGLPLAAYAHYDGELLPDSVAVMEYRMVMSINPKDTVVRNKLGMVYIRQDKLDKARTEFMNILDIAPDDFDALDSLGIVSDKQDRLEEAVDWFKKAVEARPDDEGARARLGEAEKKLR